MIWYVIPPENPDQNVRPDPYTTPNKQGLNLEGRCVLWGPWWLKLDQQALPVYQTGPAVEDEGGWRADWGWRGKSVDVFGTRKTRTDQQARPPVVRPLSVEEFAYELELPDKAGYRVCPVVHVSRLKPVREDNRRPTAELADGLGEDDRIDFDEELLPEDSWDPEAGDDELLPEDSWDPEAGDDEYVVKAILDDRWPISTGTERTQRKFYVKWRGYDDPTWEPVSNLSCGGLLFDYLLQRKRENRFQIVQVADES
ncbi:unnamed protein product [Phytophthora fragariaefolia]|uniref:Unnamed protein product n=1 Tax=Phytophthora fragariaefolia TaxID=1490495 RepID=A0A9W7CZB3_9STRA|nr:unnamed protein product [Phytophthora fragariaefolia]